MRPTLLLLIAATAVFAQPVPGYRWTHWNESNTLVAAASAPFDGVYVAGRTTPTEQTPRVFPFLYRLDADGLIRWSIQPAEFHDLGGITSDTNGTVYVAGSLTRSAAIGGNWTAGVLAVISPDGKIVRTHEFPRTTRLLNVALDAAGTAWVVGSIQGQMTSFGGPLYGFLGKVTPDGTAAIVRQIGGDRRLCYGGSGCISAFGSTQLTEVAVGPNGLIAAGGTTLSNDMKTSANAIQALTNGGGVLLVVDATGNALIESYLGGTPMYIGAINCPGSQARVTGLAFDRDGSLFVAGTNSGVRPKTTEGVLQATAPDADNCNAVTSVGFLCAVDPRTASVRFATLLGGDYGSAQGLVLREDGILFGGTASPAFPVTPGEYTRGPGVLATVSRDGRAVVQSAKLPAGIEGRPIPGPTRLFVLNEHALSAFTPIDPKAPVVFGAANAAGRPLSSSIVPGEVLSIYGNGIGPAEPQYAKFDWTGKSLDTNLAGVRVFFDGIAAPLLYADREQINLMVPFGIWRGTMQLVHDDKVVLQRDFGRWSADPAFLGSCWNAEGKLNSLENRASPGEILACWISGLGMLDPMPADGSLPEQVLPKPVNRVTTTTWLSAERPVEIEYLGQAPLAPAGVVQINFRTPGPEWPGSPTTNVRVTAGSRTASTTIWLHESTVP